MRPLGAGSSSGRSTAAVREAIRALSGGPCTFVPYIAVSSGTPSDSPPSVPRPEPATVLSVSQVRSPSRSSDTSGSTISAGGSDDHCGARPPSGANAKPPTQTGPAPAGISRGSSASRSRVSSAQVSTTSSKRRSPRDTASYALPSPASARPRSGSSQQNQRSEASREAKTSAAGSTDASSSTVTLTSLRPPRSPRLRQQALQR